MKHEKRWTQVKKIGGGGQGTVYEVIDNTIINDHTIYGLINQGFDAFNRFRQNNNNNQEELMKEVFPKFKEGIHKIIAEKDPSSHGALKILHRPEEARDAQNAIERLHREIGAMEKTKHPNLIRIIDCDPDEQWYVSPLYSRGTLAEHLEDYKGNFIKALTDFRGLVAGVAEVHKCGFVHRDIKPNNIFVDSDGKLVLGDFGLVHFDDNGHSRLSATWDNVGSRDWQPGWTMGKKIENITSSHDVFSLGKILWSMVSGEPILQLWYYDRGNNDVAKMFPNSRFIHFANRLFSKCIVENEEQCIPDAKRLLDEVDEILSAIHVGGEVMSLNIDRRCQVCGTGKYNLIVNDNLAEIQNFGIEPRGGRRMKIFSCGNCGHVQLFTFILGAEPTAWQLK